MRAKKFHFQDGYLYIVFEYMEMDLTQFMKERQTLLGRRLSEEEIKSIMR